MALVTGACLGAIHPGNFQNKDCKGFKQTHDILEDHPIYHRENAGTLGMVP